QPDRYPFRSFVAEEHPDIPRAEASRPCRRTAVGGSVVAAHVGRYERTAGEIVQARSPAQLGTEVVELLSEGDFEGAGCERNVCIENAQLAFGVQVGLELIAKKFRLFAGLSLHAEPCVIDTETQVAGLQVGFETGFETDLKT